jgi:hypothetical protein
MLDVWAYFHQREREVRELSLGPDGDFWAMVAEEAGSGGQRGRIFGRFILAEGAYLSVSEKVVVVEDHVHREEYAYFLIVDEVEIWGYERDSAPDHAAQPVHRHVERHAREPADRISFKEAVERGWAEVSDRL